MIYMSKGGRGAGADSDHMWIRPWTCKVNVVSVVIAIHCAAVVQ